MSVKSVLALSLSLVTLVLLACLFPYFQGSGRPVDGVRPDGVAGSGERGDYDSRDWESGSYVRLNMSLFTFSDNNRNGRYDLGDRPIAEVAVHLKRPDGTIVSARSNINGYANFPMLFESDQAAISRVGQDYQFSVSQPPHWRISTGNAVQVARFRHVAGSVSGLAAEQPPAVVGLMPDLRVSGRVAAAGGQTPVLTAMGPGGESLVITTDAAQRFSFVGQPGAWLLRAVHARSGAVRERSFYLDNTPLQLSLIDFDDEPLKPLSYSVIENFDYRKPSIIDKLAGGQSGLGWDFLLAIDNQKYGGPGYVNGLRSGDMVGYNSSGHPVTITPDEGEASFDFVGAYFTAAWPESQGEQLLVRAFRGDVLVGQETLELSYLGPTWLQADYHRIDRLELATAHYWQFVTEDMSFRVASDPLIGVAGAVYSATVEQ